MKQDEPDLGGTQLFCALPAFLADQRTTLRPGYAAA
jgi:hypothetical protein